MRAFFAKKKIQNVIILIKQRIVFLKLVCSLTNVTILECSAHYKGILLAPVKGWWPFATLEGPLSPQILVKLLIMLQ